MTFIKIDNRRNTFILEAASWSRHTQVLYLFKSEAFVLLGYIRPSVVRTSRLALFVKLDMLEIHIDLESVRNLPML